MHPFTYRLSCNNVAVFGKAPCAFRLLQAGSYSGLIALRKISVKPMHLIDVAQAPWKWFRIKHGNGAGGVGVCNAEAMLRN